jgi:hypothetical protein
MTRAALRADAGRQGDPLATASAVVKRAADAGRPLSLFERASLRALVRDHESRIGCSLVRECEAIAARLRDGQLADRDRAALARRLDVLEALTG